VGQRDLPLASGRDHAKAFGRAGWDLAREGNHLIMTKPGVKVALSIPNHGEVKRALLQKLIKAAGMTQQEYLRCFKGR
jgi:predicted RNA binding protein YcfA (HicA-like mRNA interferase family)